MKSFHFMVLCGFVALASLIFASNKPLLRALPVMNEVPLYRSAPPGKTDTAIAYLSMKDTLTFLDSAKGWSRVITQKRLEGFVQSHLIAILPPSHRHTPAIIADLSEEAPNLDVALEGVSGIKTKKEAKAEEKKKEVNPSVAAPHRGMLALLAGKDRDKSSDAGLDRKSQEVTVKAAAHDDNAEFPQYQKYCLKNQVQNLGISYPWDASKRLIIRVQDQDNTTVPWAHVQLLNHLNRPIFNATTPANGEIIILPNVDLSEQSGLSIRVNNGDARPLKQRPDDDAFTLVIPNKRQIPQTIAAQICFLVDATGSMGDEIEQLQNVIFSIHERLRALPGAPALQFSLTAYRDQGDAFLVKGRPFTANIDTFQAALNKLSADGGGDNPEDVEAGLGYALDSLKWKEGTLKFIFLIADAPPHTEIPRPDNYLVMARTARSRGILICPIGASGLDQTGEFVFRQLALLTGTEFVFLNYGEKGESDGAATAADPGKVSHHTGANYHAKKLDDLVVDLVRRELACLTPAIAAQRRAPVPDTDAEMLDLRLNSLLSQVLRPEFNLSGKTVVVTPFSPFDSSLIGISNYLWEGALGLAPKLVPVNIIERTRIAEILKEHALSQTGAIDPAHEAKTGKLLGADYVLLTQVNYLGLTAFCHSRLIDCVSGAIVSAARVRL